MISGMFRGKESSNRIELSRLVQELLNFGVSGSLWLWGWGWVDGVGGGWGVPPHMCTCMHMNAYMHMHTHACMVNMIISCKWPPSLDLGKSQRFPMKSYVCARPCMHVHVHVCIEHPLTTSYPHPPTHGWVYSLVGGWVDGWGQVKTLKILKMLTESR